MHRFASLACALTLLGAGCVGDTTDAGDADSKESRSPGDGEPGDGDGDGDGDGEPGDGDGEPGDGDGEPGDGDGEPGDGDGEPGDGDGDGEPLSCEEIVLVYKALAAANTSCSNDDQCQVLNGHCWMGLGGCWYVVNTDISQADLDALANQYQGQLCLGPVCACLPPPANVGCVAGTCEQL